MAITMVDDSAVKEGQVGKMFVSEQESVWMYMENCRPCSYMICYVDCLRCLLRSLVTPWVGKRHTHARSEFGKGETVCTRRLDQENNKCTVTRNWNESVSANGAVHSYTECHYGFCYVHC